MKAILQSIINHYVLSFDTAKELMLDIANAKHNPSEIASLLSLLQQRGIHAQELAGFREALLQKAVRVNLNCPDAIDIVGTGGDGKNSFNISTATAFVVAASGIPVIKHGNYSASSISGSSHIFEQLGFTLTADQVTLQSYLDQLSICFLHAPCFHPSMKEVVPVRKELKIPTFFNILGPLINPASVSKLCLGVANLSTFRLYKHLLQETDLHYTIVHNIDGYDELSLTDDARVYHHTQGEQVYTPQALGEGKINPQDIYGGNTTQEAFDLFMRILSGKGSPAQNQVVIANATLAIQLAKPELSLAQARDLATASLMERKAYDIIQQIQS